MVMNSKMAVTAGAPVCLLEWTQRRGGGLLLTLNLSRLQNDGQKSQPRDFVDFVRKHDIHTLPFVL